MMDREWRAILARYGQPVTVRPRGGGPGAVVRAFLQPVLDKGEGQQVPSPLGRRREDRLLYLGPPDLPLTRNSRVEGEAGRYAVWSAHRVGGSHWWALLRPLDEEDEG